jgi:formylglycine-generating enzyme required for sulfatase activity
MQPFAIGRFEITFDDWSQCVTAGGCSELPPDAGFGAGARPVINVSYQAIDAQYLPWLSKVSGKSYRLPTSQEWDIAEAGGEAGVNRGLIAPDYQSLCRSANFATTQAGAVACDDPFPQSAPVGSYQPNAIGLHDMRGNVWEWVSDCWTPGFNYKTKPSERDCRKHVVRGGSWSSQPALGAAAPKGFEDQTRASKTIGFRIARSLP